MSVAALLLAAGGPTTPAWALEPVDESMVDGSPLIVFGEVLSFRPGLEGAGRTTEYLFRIEEVLKGFVGGSAIVVRPPDGVRADDMAVTGLPVLAEGDRLLLFLESGDSDAYAIAEYSQGLFRDLSRFRHWIADRVAGVERAADYFKTERPADPGVVRSADRLVAGRTGERLASDNPTTAPATSSCSGVTCLLQGERFRVKAWYSSGGSGGSAGAVGSALGGSAGLFTSDSGSSELLVRVVNRCSTKGYWAVYAGAASDADFNVAIRDTRSNELKWFKVQAGRAVADASAFSCASGDAGAATAGPGVDSDSQCRGVTCLLQTGAFRLKTWYLRPGRSSRPAPTVAVNLGESAGLFTSDSGHSELLVRIVNQCTTTGYWTVYAGAASDSDFRMAIRDTRSNELEWFRVRAGHSVADAEAFPCLGGDASISDRAALTALYEATSGRNWTEDTNWLTGKPLGEWHGVTTDESGNVVRLDLRGNFLVGEIPPELGSLAHLQDLRLSRNVLLNGPLPPEFFDLTDLRYLSLESTRIGGPIPAAIGELGQLRYLRWQFSGLTGPIPPELANLKWLTWLDLSYNYMIGAIPPELGDLSNLSTLVLRGNELTGPIPAELGRLSRLDTLHLESNHLTGEIPAEFGDLANLRRLRLDENELRGAIPEALLGLSRLQWLGLGDNGFAGSIPSGLSTLGELRRLELQDNALSGRLPDEIGALTKLTDLWVGGNAALVGPVPTSLARLDDLTSFKAGETRLCVPQDPELLAWLNGVPVHRLARCEPAEAYLTQSVQSREFPVPLVAYRSALLRVFMARKNTGGTRMPEVRATFYVDDAEVHSVVIPGGAGRVPAEIDESSLAGSANADVPGSVIRPGLEMMIEIDPDGMLRRRLPDRGRLAVDVVELPNLQLTVVPFLYEIDPDRSILEITQGMAAAPEEHVMLADTRTLLPIGGLELHLHDPVLTSTDSPFTVLRETEMIRLMEGRPGYWLSMMSPVRIGVLGLAFGVPSWSSFSQPLPSTVAHELGHNMGLFHAPCGGARGTDPGYPHPSGVIGSWGYDRDAKRLVSPYSPDLMSYCEGYWISDYHLANALRHRMKSEDVGTAGAMTRFGRVSASGVRSARMRSLLVSGGLDADGNPFLEPAVIADALTSLPAPGRDYVLKGTTEDGSVAFSLQFDMPELPDLDDGRSAFVFSIPVSWEGALERISLLGDEESVVLNQDTDQPLSILRDPATGQVQAILRRPVTEALEIAGDGSLEVVATRGLPAER